MDKDGTGYELLTEGSETEYTYSLDEPGVYRFAVKAVYNDDQISPSSNIVNMGRIEEFDTDDIPVEISLLPHYPDPVTNSTQLRFGLQKPANISISIYNLKGQLVGSIKQPNMQPGYHSVTYDMHDLRSGIYF